MIVLYHSLTTPRSRSSVGDAGWLRDRPARAAARGLDQEPAGAIDVDVLVPDEQQGVVK